MEDSLHLRIMIIAPTPYFSDRGCHVRIYEESKALRQLGNYVFICTYHLGKDTDDIPIYRTLRIPFYKKTEAGPSRTKVFLDFLLFFLCLFRGLKERPQIIHAHLHEGAFIGSIVGKLLRIPVVADMQGSMFKEMVDHHFIKEKGLRAAFWRFVEKIVVRMPALLLPSSSQGSKYFVEILGLPPEKVITVDDGVSTDLIRPGYDVSDLKKEIGLGDDKRILLYLGILTKYQGIDLMIEAMKYLAQKRNDFIFLIVGFPNVEYYCEMAKNLEVSDHVKLTGRIGQERVPQFLCLGEIGLTAKTSATEANGKVLSYMAAGLPVVAIDTPVNRELIGDYGTYSKNPDPQSFAEAIDDLFHDEKRLEYLKRSVREYVEKNWTWMRSTEHIIRIYKSLLN